MGMAAGSPVAVSVSELNFIPSGEHVSLASSDIASAISLNEYVVNPRPGGAHKILIQALDQNVRYTLNGRTSPTATKGFRLVADVSPMMIPIPSEAEIIVIRESSGAGLEYQWGQ